MTNEKTEKEKPIESFYIVKRYPVHGTENIQGDLNIYAKKGYRPIFNYVYNIKASRHSNDNLVIVYERRRNL